MTGCPSPSISVTFYRNINQDALFRPVFDQMHSCRAFFFEHFVSSLVLLSKGTRRAKNIFMYIDGPENSRFTLGP